MIYWCWPLKKTSGFRRWRLAEHNQYVLIPFLMIISSDHSDRQRCLYWLTPLVCLLDLFHFFILALHLIRVQSGQSRPAVITAFFSFFSPSARANDPDLEGDVILHLVDEVDHLGRQDVALVQHAGQLWRGDRARREQWVQGEKVKR